MKLVNLKKLVDQVNKRPMTLRKLEKALGEMGGGGMKQGEWWHLDRTFKNVHLLSENLQKCLDWILSGKVIPNQV